VLIFPLRSDPEAICLAKRSMMLPSAGRNHRRPPLWIFRLWRPRRNPRIYIFMGQRRRRPHRPEPAVDQHRPRSEKCLSTAHCTKRHSIRGANGLIAILATTSATTSPASRLRSRTSLPCPPSASISTGRGLLKLGYFRHHIFDRNYQRPRASQSRDQRSDGIDFAI